MAKAKEIIVQESVEDLQKYLRNPSFWHFRTLWFRPRSMWWYGYYERKIELSLMRKSETDKAFSTVAALIRIHFTSHLDLYWVIKNGRRSYQKRTKSKNKVPKAVQVSLFDGWKGGVTFWKQQIWNVSNWITIMKIQNDFLIGQ